MLNNCRIVDFENRIFKHSPINFYVKIRPLFRAPVLMRAKYCLQFIIFIIWGCLHSNITNFSIVVLHRKLFKYFLYLFLCKTLNFSCAPNIDQGSRFQQFRINIIWEGLHSNLTNCCIVVHWKRISKLFPFNSCWTLDLSLGPQQ